MFELLNDLDTEIRRYNRDTMRPRVRRHSALLCCARFPYVLYASLPRLAAHRACATLGSSTSRRVGAMDFCAGRWSHIGHMATEHGAESPVPI